MRRPDGATAAPASGATDRSAGVRRIVVGGDAKYAELTELTKEFFLTFKQRVKIIADAVGGYDRAVACSLGAYHMTCFSRYLTCPGVGGDWVVVDQDRNQEAVMHCCDAGGAALIAALMNGDLDALAGADRQSLATCHDAIGGALRLPKPNAKPSVGSGLLIQL